MFVLPLHKLCKHWKSYNILNIVNISKKKIDFSSEKRKNAISSKMQKLSVQPNILGARLGDHSIANHLLTELRNY
jgi:hypothetical protein